MILGVGKAHSRAPSPSTTAKDSPTATAEVSLSKDLQFVLVNIKNIPGNNLRLKVRVDYLRAIINGEEEGASEEGEEEDRSVDKDNNLFIETDGPIDPLAGKVLNTDP